MNPRRTAFAGRVAVITGAGSGIGRALAVDLARRGARLALSSHSAERAKETARLCRALGATVEVDRLDVADRAAVLEYAQDVRARLGAVHQVYNNAGITFFGSVAGESFEQIEQVMDVNFWGTVNVTKAFLPQLVESGDGHLINIASVFSLMGFPGQSAYSASKFAMRGFTESLRQELLIAGVPVSVTCVMPGGVKTGIARNAMAAEGVDAAAVAAAFDRRLARHTPETAAAVILRGVRRRRARVLVGGDAKVLDGIARLSPVGGQRAGILLSRFAGLSKRAQ